jgi:hypothetical protein
VKRIGLEALEDGAWEGKSYQVTIILALPVLIVRAKALVRARSGGSSISSDWGGQLLFAPDGAHCRQGCLRH